MLRATDHALETRLPTRDGAILCQPRFAQQAGEDWFDPEYWAAQAESSRGGRGAVWFVRGPFGAAVLRHYRRGGVIAKLSRDRYLWQGEARTRAFAEFRLLQRLHHSGLPVPQPIACRYRRFAAWYSADLITAQIPDARSLAELLPGVLTEAESLDKLGAMLAEFHFAGCCHADLNAHNLLRDAAARWWLIDFDRGRIRPPERRWQQHRLQRLQRSLLKLGAAASPLWAAAWQDLVASHDRELVVLER